MRTMSFMMHCVLFWFLSLCFLMYGLVKIFHLFKNCKVHSNFLLLGCFLISSYPLLDCIAISISENQWWVLPIVGGERSVLEKGLAMQLRVHSILLFSCLTWELSLPGWSLILFYCSVLHRWMGSQDVFGPLYFLKDLTSLPSCLALVLRIPVSTMRLSSLLICVDGICVENTFTY